MSKLAPHHKKRHVVNERDKAHMARVRGLGCIVCFNETDELGVPAEIHHLRSHPLNGTHLGLGQRAPHTHTIPLCPAHHRGPFGVGYHGGPGEFQRLFGTEAELWAQVGLLLEAG